MSPRVAEPGGCAATGCVAGFRAARRVLRWRGFALLLLAACSGGGGKAPPLHTTIGAAGGTLMVGAGELTLTVPPGALRGDVAISVETDAADAVAGWLAVSAAFRFEPAATAFGDPAQLILPYSPSRVSDIVAGTELRIGWRDAMGGLQLLEPQSADGGSAVLEIDALGTFWVLAPDVVTAAELFPLHDGDHYLFDSGLELDVARSTSVPNLNSIDVAELRFSWNEQVSGIYLDPSQGLLGKFGEFHDPDWQEVYALPAELVGMRDAIGSVRPASVTFAGYVPLGATTATYHGVADVTTALVGRERRRVPLGEFDCVRVQITTRFHNSFAERGETVLTLWLRKGTGPVALQFGDVPLLMGLREATVGGRAVVGN